MRISIKRYAMLNMYEQPYEQSDIRTRVMEFQITPLIASGHGMCLGYVRSSVGRHIPVVVVLTSLFMHDDDRQQAYNFERMDAATNFLVQRVTAALEDPRTYHDVRAVAEELYIIMRRREERAAELAT